MSKILVIDDEKSIRNTLKEVLEYEKHEVDLAEDGAGGIELFSSRLKVFRNLFRCLILIFIFLISNVIEGIFSPGFKPLCRARIPRK